MIRDRQRGCNDVYRLMSGSVYSSSRPSAFYAFSSVHWSGCWFWRAKSITWFTFVSATS